MKPGLVWREIKKYLKHRAIEKDACEGLIDEKLYNEGSNIRNN